MTYKVNYSLVETLRESLSWAILFTIAWSILTRVRVLLDGRVTRIEFSSKLINLFWRSSDDRVMENDASPDKKLAALANSYQIFFIVKNYEKRAERCREANKTFNVAPRIFVINWRTHFIADKNQILPTKTMLRSVEIYFIVNSISWRLL